MGSDLSTCGACSCFPRSQRAASCFGVAGLHSLKSALARQTTLQQTPCSACALLHWLPVRILQQESAMAEVPSLHQLCVSSLSCTFDWQPHYRTLQVCNLSPSMLPRECHGICQLSLPKAQNRCLQRCNARKHHSLVSTLDVQAPADT